MAVNDALAQIAAQQLPNLISEIEVRSAFSPPYKINVAEALKPQPPGAPVTFKERLVKLSKPTVILRGAIKQTIAPYGAANTQDWKINLGFLMVCVASVAVLSTMAIYNVGAFRATRRLSR